VRDVMRTTRPAEEIEHSLSDLNFCNSFNVVTFFEMSCAKIDPALHQAQKPPWIKVRLPSNPVFFSTKALISDLRLHTVCGKRAMPESLGMLEPGHRYFHDRGRPLHAGVRILRGDDCKTFALEGDEPKRVAEAVRRMNLKHVVITAVARERSEGRRRNHFARTITAIREMDPSIVIEVLVPDFHAYDWCIQTVLNAGPDIYNHNMETVERLTPVVRSRAKYRISLQVLGVQRNFRPRL